MATIHSAVFTVLIQTPGAESNCGPGPVWLSLSPSSAPGSGGDVAEDSDSQTLPLFLLCLLLPIENRRNSSVSSAGCARAGTSFFTRDSWTEEGKRGAGSTSSCLKWRPLLKHAIARFKICGSPWPIFFLEVPESRKCRRKFGGRIRQCF